MSSKIILPLFLLFLLPFTCVCQSNSWRVISYGFYKGDSSYSQNLMLEDTAVSMNYTDFVPGSSQFSSDVSHGVFQYDSSEIWKGYTPTSGNYAKKIKHYQTFRHYFTPYQLRSSLYQELDTLTSNWINTTKTHYGSGDADSFFLWINNNWILKTRTLFGWYGSRTEQVYDSTNLSWINKIWIQSMPGPGGTVDTTIYYSWNDSLLTWKADSSSIYTHQSNKLVKHTKRQWNAITSSWINLSRDLYSYYNQISYSTSTVRHEVWNSGWQVQSLDSIRNGFGQDTSFVIHNNWDSTSQQFNPAFRWTEFYEAGGYGPMTTQVRQEYFNGDWVYGPESYYRHYNYEQFFLYPWEGINKLPSSIASISLFPVPANDVLNIRMEWKKQQPFDVAITDNMGRTVMQWKEKGATSYSKPILISFLPAGHYQLTIRSEGGSVSRAFVIVR
jgi:hypothetical protein